MKWKIGNVEIDNQIVLAPMAGVCDSAFRTIIKSMGCGLIESEMVSDKSVMYGSVKAKKMLYMTDYERPIAQQIFGCEVKSFKIAAKYIEENIRPDIIDINMGCPVPKVAVKLNAGSALLKNPQKAYEIVKEVVNTVSTPVSVKIRSGWDENVACEIARLVEKAGAKAIAVHPRTRHQKYDVPSDWSIIKDVKNSVSIPVIGNGDVRSCYAAKAMLDMTGCDAVMIGRATLGNPWIIKECVDYLDHNIKPKEITMDEKIAMLKRHTDLLIKLRGETAAMARIKTPAAHYVKGLPGIVDVKPKIFKCKSRDELFRVLDDYRNGKK